MEKEPTSAFRTKVRVKARSRPEQDAAASGLSAPPQKPSSLMEALKQVRTSHSTSAETNVEVSDTKRESRSPETPQPAEEARIDRPKRPATARVGRLAAAKLRQLQRLQEAAATLEMLARGEIEEATVEIIRRDSKQTTDHQTSNPQKR